ncbi:MAG: hypothetical protein JWQ07_82 [Ramlibacter sp.]|nr:hypothetical protein [Ramlibacter sp.]
MPLYEIAVLGSPTGTQLKALSKFFAQAAERFKLEIGRDIALSVQPRKFKPNAKAACAAIFFGGQDSAKIDVSDVVDQDVVPILPVASTSRSVSQEIPAPLQALNCVFYKENGSERVFSALLECVGLLPRQRRVFLSYRRLEATPIAIQLFAELSARQYEVFLDTHKIGAGVNFQESLWHQLCDVDVLVMLDTPGYFESRWTAAEYGRALAKGIGVLRVQWPDSTPSIRTETSSRVELLANEFNSAGQLVTPAMDRICSQLEDFRSLAHATRHLSIVNAIHDAVIKVQGRVDGIGVNRTMQVTLRSGRKLMVQPTVGVPTAVTLQDALSRAGATESAVVYDHMGLMPSWQSHIDWLAEKVAGARWVKMTEAAWDFAGWET